MKRSTPYSKALEKMIMTKAKLKNCTDEKKKEKLKVVYEKAHANYVRERKKAN
jgi:hypothetical protein